MQRIHAMEFHDWTHCPAFIRESIVETLGTALKWGEIIPSITPCFIKFCELSHCHRILDLCSGSGIPASLLADNITSLNFLKIVLTDLYPNKESFRKIVAKNPKKMAYLSHPVDATQISYQGQGTALMVLNAFHHFPTSLAKAILQNALQNRHPIFIHESFPRRPWRLLSMLHLLIPAVFLNPFTTKDHRLLKFIFTYLIPLIPILGLWDGLISTLRVYNKEELLEMIKELSELTGQNEKWSWTYSEVAFRPLGLAHVFYGFPL